jgi:acetyl-CoA carboxylase carboxyltransferase component
MCGKAYDPRLIFSWPTAQVAVMGGKQASETLLSIRLSQSAAKGKEIPKEEKEKLLKEISQTYDHEVDPFYGAARLHVDGIVDPADTRQIISRGIAMASNNPNIPAFNPGVIQV